MAGRSNPERDFQCTLVSWLRRVLPAGSIVASVTNEHASIAKPGSLAAARFHQKRKKQGVWPGYSDLNLLLPEGRCFLLEVKAPGSGTLSSSQQQFERDARAIGHDFGVADSEETARWALTQAGIKLTEPSGQPSWEWSGYRAPNTRLLDDALPF